MNTMDREKLKRTDKMYIVGGNIVYGNDAKLDWDKKEVCYNPMKLSTHGWCYLKDFPEKYEDGNKWNHIPGWGICSPSCALVYRQINSQHKIFIFIHIRVNTSLLYYSEMTPVAQRDLTRYT